jgi:hypothetical protein
MNRFHSFRRFNFLTLFFGLFMLAVMAGCVHVETTISPCGDGKAGDDPGACNPVTYTGPATNFWDDATGAPYTGTDNCAAGSKKCASTPGRCANGTQCKSRVNSSTMLCKCDCKP